MIRRNCLFTKKFINGSRTKKYWETLSLRHAVFSRCKLLYSTDLGFKVMSDGQAKKMHSWNIRDLSEPFECKEGNSQNKTKKQTLVCVFMRKKKKKSLLRFISLFLTVPAGKRKFSKWNWTKGNFWVFWKLANFKTVLFLFLHFYSIRSS